MKQKASVLLAAGLLAIGSIATTSLANATVVTNTFVSNTDIYNAMGTTATIGFAYAGNKFVGSVQRDGTNVLYQTDLTGGNVAPFASSVSLAVSSSSEHFVTSSLGLGGFGNRDVFVASGNGVVRISNDGTTSSQFVSGLNGIVRGILFDAVGTFSHQMLVTTTAGGVYQVNSAGIATLIASTGEDTEGLDIAVAGPYQGDLVVASEGSGNIRAIDPTSHAMSVIANVSGAEELTFVPMDLNTSDTVEGFYGANYPYNVQKADASQFTGMLGDIIVTGEYTHKITSLHWDGTNYVSTDLGSFPNQPEDGIFVTKAIVTGNQGVPAPMSVVLLATGLLGLGIGLRRRVSTC